MKSSLSYEIYTFSYDAALEKKPTVIATNGGKSAYPSTMKKTNYELLFTEGYLKNPNKAKAKEEFLYMDMKYDFSKAPNELPMCIFSYNPGLTARKRHIAYFDKLENYNYTNYHIVYVVDDITDN